MAERAYGKVPERGGGVIVRQAESIDKALRLLESDRFDLILMGFEFPGGKQPEDLLRHIASLEKTLRTPVLVLADGAQKAIRDKFLGLGAADCLLKSPNPAGLKWIVRNILDSATIGQGLKWCGSPARVLHVEDEDDWARLVHSWLEGCGWAMHRVNGGRELMRFLRTCRELPDCIILDLTLPGNDGLELCRELKTNLIFQRIPLIVLSGRKEDRIAAMENLALNLIAKDEHTDRELPAMVRSVISQQERSAGVVVRGDIRLEPRGKKVFLDNRILCALDENGFAVLRLLVENSPAVVSDAMIRSLTKKREDYRRRNSSADPTPGTIPVYVSTLRNRVGDILGRRIVRLHGLGYSYIPDCN
ncbi:MAG: hypothetical protein COB53_06935 [Elusimicrobia bacterium]|nr:MAG: hypothetical protein COB53_06935 [Elusimicrobiota bacterium]